MNYAGPAESAYPIDRQVKTMESVTHERPTAPIEQRRLEAAVGTALKQLASRQNMLVTAAQSIGLDQPNRADPSVDGLRNALPAELVELIEGATGMKFEQVAPALALSLTRAVRLASADRMPLQDTMLAMERLIQRDRVELFSRGLPLS